MSTSMVPMGFRLTPEDHAAVKVIADKQPGMSLSSVLQIMVVEQTKRINAEGWSSVFYKQEGKENEQE